MKDISLAGRGVDQKQQASFVFSSLQRSLSELLLRLRYEIVALRRYSAAGGVLVWRWLRYNPLCVVTQPPEVCWFGGGFDTLRFASLLSRRRFAGLAVAE